MGSIDWREFVERNSIIDQILHEDIYYPLMDFSTRDNYRQVIEQIAKNAKLQESEVAKMVLELAKESAEKHGADDRKAHVGYYLISDGLPKTEKRAKMRLPLATVLRRKVRKAPFFIYISFVLIVTLGITAVIAFDAYDETGSYKLAIIMGVITLICASQFAVSLVNFLSMLLVHPKLLPRMGFSEGMPDGSRTLVAIPSMLISANDIENLVEALEVRYLANKHDNLYFGLITDFTDAPEKEMPGDEALVKLARERIEELNKKYGREKNDLFYFFNRPRKWNAADKIWMGYERKRGKLAELNGLLRGHGKENFSVVVGDLTPLSGVKYVITLDSDTELPRDAAWKIVGSMAHPLNRAVYDAKKNRVTEGYGILQPRVSVSMPDIETTLYARMNGNEPGIDPYTRAVSDVYQDLFREGSFIGKGIYDVDIFEQALNGMFPENRILSHDLLEGCYVRSGLLSDVQLYEKYPVRYDTDMQRRRRWLRGDWQIAAWCLPFAPDSQRHWHLNTLSALSRWKIFDNIRRSLVPIAFTVFILLGWTVMLSTDVWTLVITALIILPVVISTLWDLLRKPKDLILSHHLLVSGRSAGSVAIKTLYTMICLPYEAYINIRTILQTVGRMVFTKKHLLQWVSFASVERSKRKSLLSSYILMFVEPLIAIAAFAYLLQSSSDTLDVAGPILALWITAPFITWWVSRPLKGKAARLSEDALIILKNWRAKRGHSSTSL